LYPRKRYVIVPDTRHVSPFAQADSAVLSGTVTDPSGAVVVNATVEAMNEDTNVAQTTHTNSAGLNAFRI
jgi:hypothetical protein